MECSVQDDGFHPRGPLEPRRYCRKLLRERWCPQSNCSWDSNVQPSLSPALASALPRKHRDYLAEHSLGNFVSCQLSALLPAEITVLFAKQANNFHTAGWLRSSSDFLLQAAQSGDPLGIGSDSAWVSKSYLLKLIDWADISWNYPKYHNGILREKKKTINWAGDKEKFLLLKPRGWNLSSAVHSAVVFLTRKLHE